MEFADLRRRNRSRKLSVEGLEGRQLLTAAVAPLSPAIAMVSATTTDSKSVTITYDVSNAPLGAPLTVGVYRSADASYGTGDTQVGSVTISPTTVDQNGNSATAEGKHTVTEPLPNGLPLDPLKPYVVVVADPAGSLPAAEKTVDSASFRVYSIGVIVHGGLQSKSYDASGPPWERRMAAQLLADGYDSVIPYNWVASSGTAGAAALQAPKLATLVVNAATQFPANSVVDVHYIGHSEGAVVNSQTVLLINKVGAPANMQAGWLEMTMLDPHAANNGVPGKQYSVSNGLLGWIANEEIKGYQSRAKDPAVVVPSNVDQAEVFFQRTPARKAESNNGIYNLWGQVPIHGDATYFNLTASGVSHAGRFGVQDWYRLNVVPTLGDGAPQIQESTLTGAQVGTPAPATFSRQTVTYAGTSASSALVRLYAAPPGEKTLKLVGRTRASEDGTWTATTFPLPPGKYRVVAMSNDPKAISPWHRHLAMRPTAYFGDTQV